MALDDKTFFRVLRNGGVTRQVTQAILDRLTALGGSPAGVPVVREFPFAFDTPDLLAGHSVYTPAVDEVLLDAWIEINTAWDGTTPHADFAQFLGEDPNGFFGDQNGPVLLTIADAAAGATIPTGMKAQMGGAGIVNNSLLAQCVSSAGRRLPARFTTADPVKVIVNQNGVLGSFDAESTQGTAVLCLVTCIPVAG